jgi:benzodiazapine receptor
MKLKFILIPALVSMVAIAGSRLTGAGMEWYRTIALPTCTPPGSMIGIIWTAIFALCAIALFRFESSMPRDADFRRIRILFVINGLLNIGWSFLFFTLHSITGALVEMHFLFLSIIALIWLLRRRSVAAAVLLIPYALWVAFATILTYVVQSLN